MHTEDRLHALDAVRAFALLLGIVFHAGFSFVPGMIPGLWAMVDVSTGTPVAVLLYVSHIFRMSLFFFLAGFFGRMLFQRKGVRAFWRDRLERVLVPLVAGWPLLFPLIAAVWIWGLTRMFPGVPLTPPAAGPDAPAAAFPLTHLWFLYYLLILYVVVTTIRGGVAAIDRREALRRGVDNALRHLVDRGALAVVLALPIAAALYARANWVGWWGIPTPDQSLIPRTASLVAYGTAMAAGWLMQRQPDLLQAWRRQWPVHLAVATVATVVCLTIAGPNASFTPMERGTRTMIYAFVYALAIWSWISAVVGAALRFLWRESAFRRYVADSSYWLYLVHLPVVAALQVMVGRLPLHWSLKFPLVLAASLAILFASYHLFVRFTFVGALLNGRRHRRGSAGTPAGVSLTQLAGVHKH